MHLETRLDESENGIKCILEYVIDDEDVSRMANFVEDVILRDLTEDERERVRTEIERRLAHEYERWARTHVNRMAERYGGLADG